MEHENNHNSREQGSAEPSGQREYFLPNFCGISAAFTVFVMAELFAFILTLADYQNSANPWADLAFTSLFMQWVALCSAWVLCLTRRLLTRIPTGRAAVITYLLLLAMVALLSEIAYYIIGFLLFEDQISRGEFLARNLAVGAIVLFLGLRYFYIQQQWKLRVRAEAEARLAALQARIRPHFLFNSMNTIASLIATHPDEAEEAVEDLADLFRASLKTERKVIPLGEEINLCKRYLHMEQLRLGERLSVEWELGGIDGTLPFPPLLLQPLVENAVYHGIEPRPEGGTVSIQIRVHPESYTIEVVNPLVEGGGSSSREGNQIALANIRERLNAQYGGRAGLSLRERRSDFVVRITIPIEEEGDEDPDR